jgi:GDP-L-fucose synthase
MNTYLFEACRKFGVKKIVNPIANCSYPDVAQKDFKESEWWDGPLHSSVFVYGFAKKATWVNAYAYHRQHHLNSVNFLVPNMYGPEDHFDEVRSHAMGALIMKMVKAKRENLPEVLVWGSGNPVREWLYVDDLVELMLRAIDVETGIQPINVGKGEGITIREMAEKIKEAVGYGGKIVFDKTRPDGAAYKVMNVARMEEIFKWIPPTPLIEGIKQTVDWHSQNVLKNI